MQSTDLKATEFNEYYARYINMVPPTISLVDAYIEGGQETLDFFTNLPERKLDFRYASDKWNCKEIFQHLIDTERIFMYRCLRIARNDKTPLAGFDQNTYIDPSGASQKSIDALVKEYDANRNNSIQLLKSLSDMHLSNMGNASGSELSARAAAFIIPGHDLWHIGIIKERYL